MKALFFSHQADFVYGGEVVTLAFMAELARTGVEVHFASPAGPYQERARKLEGVTVHEVPSRQFSRRLSGLPALVLSLWRTRSALRDIVEREKVDLVHATSLKAMVYARFLRATVLWHHHDILPAGWANHAWVRWLAAGAERILVPSEATRASLTDAGVTPGKCFVLHNGFRPEDWQARPPRRPGVKFKVLLLGEISPRKGTDRIIGILEALRRNGGAEGCEFVVVGDAVSAPGFASVLRQELKNEPVTFLGRREDVKQILQGADLLLVPSRQDPLPTVVVEAGLSGVPALGSRAGGIPEMIMPGENGFLAETDEEYALAIVEARDVTRWQALSAGARARAEGAYDIRKLAAELKRHYEEVSRGSRAGSRENPGTSRG